MAEAEEDPTADDRPPIAWSDGAVPFAYVAGRAIVRGDAAADYFAAITERPYERTVIGGRDETTDTTWMVLEVVGESSEGRDETLAAIELARADGFEVQPDHVFFAHGCDECGCDPHPSLTFDAILANPYRANPYRANPYRANPYRANPYRANPYRANPHRANPQVSSAIPAAKRVFPSYELTGSGAHPRITVLDTGLAEGAQLPALLGGRR